MLKAVSDALAAEEWIEVVGFATNSDDAMSTAESTRPDVAVLDLRLKGSESSGILVAERMLERLPSLGIAVYSAHLSNAWLQKLTQIGVLGYVSKTEPTTVLVDAIGAASRGHTFYSADARVLAEATRTSYDEAVRTITAREGEIIQLIADGQSNPEIAQLLSVSVSTVNNAVISAMHKLGAGNRVELVMRAVRARLIVVDG